LVKELEKYRRKYDPVAEFIHECVTTEGGTIFRSVADLISSACKYMMRKDMTIPNEAAIKKSLIRMLGETKQHRIENGWVRGYFGLEEYICLG